MTAPTNRRALDGVRVVDASGSVAGQYCSRLLADAGAEVFLIEPPRGCEVRWKGPYWKDGSRPDDSILFWHLNAGKKSATLDLTQRTGQRLLERFLATAQVVVAESGSPGADRWANRPDTPWTCWVDEFERTASFADWKGSELVHQAMSGVMFENGAPGQRPLYGVGRRSYYAAGTAAYIATLGALHAIAAGNHVASARINVSETAPAMNHCAGTQYWYNRTMGQRGAQISPTMMIECRDGWVVTFPSAVRWAGTCRAFGVPELIDDPRYAEEESRLSRWTEIRDAIQAATLTVTRAEVIAAAERERAIIAGVANPRDLREDEHLCSRQHWQEVTDGARRRPAMSPSIRSVGAPQTPRQRAPRLGEHTQSVLADLGVTNDEYTYLRNLGMV